MTTASYKPSTDVHMRNAQDMARYMQVPYLRQLQEDFLGKLSELEARKPEGGRIVDSDQEYLISVLRECKKPLDVLFAVRLEVLKAAMYGIGSTKPDVLRPGIVEVCKENQVWWIDNWCWIFNPWLTKYNALVDGGFPSTLPFVLYTRQEDYIRWKEELYLTGKSGLVYKSREIGASWVNTVNQAWHWAFERGFQGRFGSRKVDLVDDKNNPDSLLWKFRFVVYNLPFWMRHPDMKQRNNKYDTLLKIFNPVNGAVVAGEGGDNMGTGGRAAMYDCDEWAKVEHAPAVRSNLSQNSQCIVFSSTPNGSDTDYAAMYRGGRIAVFDFAWYHDPRKTPDWYENFKENWDPTIVAQEVDRSFTASNLGEAIREEWVNAAVELYKRIEDGTVQYPDPSPRIAALDIAAGGVNRTVWAHREGIVVKNPVEWNLDNATIIAQQAASQTEIAGCDILNYDVVTYGFGVKSAFELGSYKFDPIGVDARGTATRIPLPGDTHPAGERCKNRRAEMAVRLSRRFEKTYEFIEKGIVHPLEDLIAICNNPRLRGQLSLPRLLLENGKYKLEDKITMVRRGIESPDYFDVTMLLFADEIAGKRVLRHSDIKTMKSEFDVEWFLVEPRRQAYHYVAVQHDKDMRASAIGAVWWAQQRELQVYAEFELLQPTASAVWEKICSTFKRNVYEYLMNREVFGRAEQEDSLFLQYMDYCIPVENTEYNEMSAIARLDAMLATGSLRIRGTSCPILLRQLSDWNRKKDAPDKANRGLVYALCNLANHLEHGFMQPEMERKTGRIGYQLSTTAQTVTFGHRWMRHSA